MPISVQELKACTVLNYKISRSGGQKYERKNEKTTLDSDTGEEVKKFDTIKKTTNKEEFDTASKLQSKVKRSLGSLGVHSPMGVILKRERTEEAEALAEKYDKEIAEFNAGSKYTDIDCWITVFNLEGRNVAQLEKVIDRMFNLLGDLQEALESCNPENIRRVLQKVSGYTEILPQAAAEAFEAAVDNARKKANEISKYDKRAQRIATKIEEEVEGKDAADVLANAEKDLQKALKATDYMKRRRAIGLRKKVGTLNKLIEDKEDTIQKLEEAKATINKSSIERARFAVMKKRAGSEESSALDNGAAKLQGAQQGARFARMNRRAKPAQSATEAQ